MNKEQIIRLAKEKGFQSKFLYNNPYKYSNNEDLRWLFWLTEVQKWLREVHGFYVTASEVWEIDGDGNLTGNIDFFESFVFNGKYESNDVFNCFSTYEKALEKGIYHALNNENVKKKK